MFFSEVLDSLTLHDGVWRVAVPEDWMQGRSVFGGLQSALAVRAMRSLVPAELPLRVLQTTFVAPVAGTVTIQVHVLRAGKSVVHAEARLVEANQTRAIVVAAFGRARASEVEVVPKAPVVVALKPPLDLGFKSGSTPNFAQHFTMRWVSGPLPFSGSRTPPRATLDIGIDDPMPTSEAHVIAIADSIPPLALSMLTARVPGSSAAWTLDMLTDRFEHLGSSGWRLHAQLLAARDGYSSQSVMVCAPEGQPVALSQQSMTVFG